MVNMAKSRIFYNIGRLFGEIGGQDNVYRKNLPPGIVTGTGGGQEIPMANLKAVPDEEDEPVQNMARNFKKLQNTKNLRAVFCCIMMVSLFILFMVMP
jgi:hypothetical protein